MIGELTNHLWQSTLFAGVAGLLVLALRRNRARVRYWLWLSASLKFFVPLALLIGVGRRLESVPAAQQIAAEIATPSVSYVVEQITQPFSTSPSDSRALPGSPAMNIAEWFPISVFVVWLAGFAAVAVMRTRAWLAVRAAIRASIPIQADWGMPARITKAHIEPGIVGILRQTLLLPEGILDRLTSRQLKAIVAHELCHVRRRDNLTSALHMLVEAVFWFHPLVWWIGSCLIAERERACDEEVIRLGNEPTDYAEGILSVCRFYHESPLISVAGVSGSNLKRRIENIMKGRPAIDLGLGKALMLVLVAIAVVTGPIAMGALRATPELMVPAPIVAIVETAVAQPTIPSPAPRIPVQAPQAPQPPLSSVPDRFEVVAIRPADPVMAPVGGPRGGGGRGGPVQVTPCSGGLQRDPSRITIRNSTIHRIITLAYGKNCRATQEIKLIAGAPDWIFTQAYDIEATFPPGTPSYTGQQLQNGEAPGLQLMLQNMLADRLQLKLHRDSKEAPLYNLVFVRDGRIKLSADQTPPAPLPPQGTIPPNPDLTPRGSFRLTVDPPAGKVTLSALGIPISTLINIFQGQEGRYVIDKTGMKGFYDIPEVTLDVGPFEIGGVSVWPEIMNQLGLKLEPARGPLEVLVIDHIERPSEN